MFKKLRKNEKGFTLVELIVVIAVLAVLATLLIPRIMNNVSDAERQRDISAARTIASEVTVHNAKALTDPAGSLTTIPATLAAGHVLLSSELTGDLALPAGTSFPSDTVVKIIVGLDGEAILEFVP
jgi:type IV pilus assembly protein PilA